jgi:hypothetical protein
VEPEPIERQRERIRQFLLKRLAGGVRRPASGWLGRLSKQFFSETEGTYAFEYDGCDEERGHCTGQVRAAWLVDSTGVRPMEATPESVPREQSGMWYRFNRISFHIAPDGERVVLCSLAGPRAGCGGTYRVVAKGDGMALVAEGVHWRA